MMLLVRNKVEDFDRWKLVFDAQDEAARAAGLNLVHLWRSADEADQVFFLFEVEDRGRAETFMSTPEAAQAGRDAGVIDGAFHFLKAWTL
jgi:hypothetical protein